MRRKAAIAQADPLGAHFHYLPFRAAWAQLLKKVWSVDVSCCPRCGGNVKILCAILEPRAIKRLLDHLGIHRPRPPNPHECLPPPGTQLLFPSAPALPAVPVLEPESAAPDNTRDPLDDDWPVDAPFADN